MAPHCNETVQLQTLLPALSDSCLVDKKRESLLRDAEIPGNDSTCQKWWKPDATTASAASRDHAGRNSSQYDTVFVREHEHVHHGHSHAHSHLHSAPDSISSVGEDFLPLVWFKLSVLTEQWKHVICTSDSTSLMIIFSTTFQLGW